MASSLDQMLTAREVAGRFNCRVETVRRWIARGDLPAHILPGGEYRIFEKDLEHILQPYNPERY
jgi:excisionase family DNA binding protein